MTMTEKRLLDLGLVSTEAVAAVLGARYLEDVGYDLPVEVRYTDVAGQVSTVGVGGDPTRS